MRYPTRVPLETRMTNSLRIRLFATAVIAAGWASAVSAQEMAGSAEQTDLAPKVELIDSSQLGCGQGKPMWTASNGGPQCAFDSATRGARITARHEASFGSIETYATVAHSTIGAFTADQLLAPPSSRRSVATDLFMVGLKGSAFDNRLKLTAEFARTNSDVDELVQRDWALADSTSSSGSSALVRLDAKLIDQPGLKWSVSGEYRSAGDDYSIGRSTELLRYFALPGTRLALSSKVRVGQLAVYAGIEEVDNIFGASAIRKAELDFQGVTLSLRSRDSRATPIEGTTRIDGRSRTDSVYLTIDMELFAGWLLPQVDRLPFLVPTTFSLGYRTGENENRFQASTQAYERTSLSLEGDWETPLGETGLSYWRDTRTGLTENVGADTSESFEIYHSVRRGNWRFGVDATLTRARGEGSNGYDERSLSFGQSIAYSAKDGPELRISLGQDRGQMQSDSYDSADNYSSITASLDLSRYLQKRFERDDLRLTLDYRKIVDRSESEFSYYDELVDRWIDSDRREGFLMSFGMKL